MARRKPDRMRNVIHAEGKPLHISMLDAAEEALGMKRSEIVRQLGEFHIPDLAARLKTGYTPEDEAQHKAQREAERKAAELKAQLES